MKKTRSAQARPDQASGLSGAGDRSVPEPSDSSPAGTESRLPPEGDRSITSFWLLPVRILWFAVGPVALLLTLAKIAGSDNGWLTVVDAVFWVVVGLMVGFRWLDQRSGVATNAFGEPSTWADFRRYAALLPLVALAAWLVANALGNHILGAGSSG